MPAARLTTSILGRVPGVRRSCRTLAGAVMTVIVLVAPASADGRKLALLIGNQAYSGLGPEAQLQTPVNDVNAVGAKLKELGFETTILNDLDRRTFLDSVHQFASQVTRDDIALFYYAGHGVNLGGGNYFLPADIPAPRGEGKSEESRMADNSVSEAQIVETIGEAQPKTFVAIFDACRDNPLKAGGKRSLGGTRGLRIEPPPAGMAALYSAGSGQQALDRLPDEQVTSSLNSVFARALIANMGTKGQSLDDLHRTLLRDVSTKAKSVGHEQFPGYYSQLFDRFYFIAPDSQPETAPAVIEQPTVNQPPVAQQPQNQPPAQQQLALAPNNAGQAQTAVAGFSIAGAHAVTLDAATRQKFNLPDQTVGIVVDTVTQGSTADNRMVQYGDVIVQVGDLPVQNVEAAANQVATLKSMGHRRALALLVRPNGQQFFTALDIE